MINDNTKKLIELGLSQREARVYLVLLKKSNFTATEIAKVSGIPRQKIYDILDNLIKKGICTEKVGKIKRYKATEPEFVCRGLVERHKNDFENELLAREKLAHELSRDLAVPYERNQERVDPLEYIEILKDRRQIYRKWKLLQSRAQHEILAFTKAPYTLPLPDGDIDDEIDILKRKVKIRAIYEYGDVKKDEFIRALSSWVFAGEEARVIKELPMKLVIFDEQITIIPLIDPISLESSLTAMIINHPGFATAQKAVFENYWESAMPYEEFMASGELE